MPQSNPGPGPAPQGGAAEKRLLVFGLGYTGAAIAQAAAAQGFVVGVTSRRAGAADANMPFAVVSFDSAGDALAAATHVVVTAPPGEEGDPVLSRWGAALRQAWALRWVGYLSTTGVYGDRGGGTVDEKTEPAPGQERSRRRLATEEAWAEALPDGVSVDLFRVGGIYGPGRSAFNDLRAGRARRVVKPGHMFSRIHRDDIAAAVVAAALRPVPGRRVLHLVDDEPVESAAVMEEAAALLGVAPPPAVPFEEAVRGMSPMARSFWDENRRVSSVATREALGIEWRYPTYREGLRGILAAEAGDEKRVEAAPQQREV